MTPELKDEWVAALESGKYKQGRGLLRNESDDYCCLGVLCDVIDGSSWVISGSGWRYDGNASSLTGRLLDKHGIKNEDQWILINQNDNGDNFKSIASFIRENL